MGTTRTYDPYVGLSRTYSPSVLGFLWQKHSDTTGSADAVVCAWNAPQCVLLGSALADFLVWLLFAVMHALYTYRFFVVLVTPQY